VHFTFTLASFVALGMRSEGNATKNREPTVGFSFTTMLQSVLIKNFLEKKEVTTLEYPPYSRGLTSADFHLFPRLKLILKGNAFVMLLISLTMRRNS
jgi:uncharacterized membrane protein YozB (DUF420 family)